MANFEIIPRAQWGAKPPTQPLSPMTQPDGWVVHYVGGPCPQDPTLDESQALVRRLQDGAFNGDNGETYIDIPYNFLVDLNGRIFEGRGFEFKSGANGSSNYNGHAWAVCVLMGVGDGNPTDKNHLTQAAKDALSWLTREGAQRSAAVSYVKGHRDVYATHCPGDEAYGFVSYLHAHLHDAAPAPAIDWKALAKLALWVHNVTENPLHAGETRPAVVSLKELLALRGFDVGNREPLYGDNLVIAVTRWKVSVDHPNSDGYVFGGPAARRILQP